MVKWGVVGNVRCRALRSPSQTYRAPPFCTLPYPILPCHPPAMPCPTAPYRSKLGHFAGVLQPLNQGHVVRDAVIRFGRPLFGEFEECCSVYNNNLRYSIVKLCIVWYDTVWCGTWCSVVYGTWWVYCVLRTAYCVLRTCSKSSSSVGPTYSSMPST